MNSNRPNVNVIYQDAPQQRGMGCAEWIVGTIVLLFMALAVTGASFSELLFGALFGGWELFWRVAMG